MSQSVSHYGSPLESLTSHGLRNHPRPTFLPEQLEIHSQGTSEQSISTMNSAKREGIRYMNTAPRHMDIDDSAVLRDVRQQLFGDDIQPEILVQSVQHQMDIEDDARRQEERQRQITEQVRQHHQDANDTMTHIMENNPFVDVFSGGASSSNQVPVKKLIDKIEKKEEEMKEEKKNM